MAWAEMNSSTVISVPRQAGNFHEMPGDKKMQNHWKNSKKGCRSEKYLLQTKMNYSAHFRPGRAEMDLLTVIFGPAGPEMDSLTAFPPGRALPISDRFF